MKFLKRVSPFHKGRGRAAIGLSGKMIMLISLLIIGIFLIFAIFLYIFLSQLIYNQAGERALGVATTVANIPEVIEAFDLNDPASVIQDITTDIQRETNAEFIVVGNREGIRYSHPIPERIGQEMIGGDNAPVLERGKSVISESKGSLGESVRGKVPIFNEEENIIGVVSVGYLKEDVQSVVLEQSKLLWWMIAGIVLLGIVGAIIIAYYIKRILLHMEPEEIAYLLEQKEVVLESAHEGILAVDEAGIITTMNARAKQILDADKKKEDVVGKSINTFIPHPHFLGELLSGKSQFNREMVLGNTIVLVSWVPIYVDEKIAGAVSTFRKKTELLSVTKELNQVKQYANAQRAQTHEFSNKLYTILGLLQLGETKEAIQFIKEEKNMQEEQSAFLIKHVEDPVIQGLLQGKMNQMEERGIVMTIHPDSQLDGKYKGVKQEALITGLGNMLENAIEAVGKKNEKEQQISVFFTDIGNDIVIEVEDSGPGVLPEDISLLFEQGYTMKEGDNRGVGLALTRQIVRKAGGEIMLEEEGELGGACFVMIIPKEGRELE